MGADVPEHICGSVSSLSRRVLSELFGPMEMAGMRGNSDLSEALYRA